jgi:23S rRNA (cytosine1962-C5)-methyltransferase
LKKGADRRIRQGHPWVFASELNGSAKEIRPGELIELHDFSGKFLAYGYGHPTSQICFRKLASSSKEKDVFSKDFFVRRLRQARDHRLNSGWGRFSHRWLYAEADGVPGLIADAFLTQAQGWIVVAQASTAGADAALPAFFEALKTFESEMGLLSAVEAPSSRARMQEGLALGEKKLVFGGAESLERTTIVLGGGLKMDCDLLNGQKTGFFLDQQWNAQLLTGAMRAQFQPPEEPVRILDVCCYVGQWAAHAAKAVAALEGEAEVTLADVSPAALEIASHNLRGLAARVDTVCGDALETLPQLPAESFDVVICDPPAFVKKKADLENGLRAYVKLNRDALKLVKPGGIFVAASCSGLVKQADWDRVLLESSQKAGRMLRAIHRGGHAPDHPVRPDFPEGEYLKCFVGRVNYPF